MIQKYVFKKKRIIIIIRVLRHFILHLLGYSYYSTADRIKNVH